MSQTTLSLADPSLLDFPASPDDDVVPADRHLIAMNALADIARGQVPLGVPCSAHALTALQDVIDHEFNERMTGLPVVATNSQVSPGAALRDVMSSFQGAQSASESSINQQAACLAIQRELQAWRGTPHAEAVGRALGSLALAFGVADGLTER